MEENNTEYTEIGTEPGTEGTSFDGYPEETAETETKTETDAGENTETEESGENVDDIPDHTDNNTADGNTADTGTDTAAPSGTSPDDTGDNSESADGDLLESLNALVKALSPEEETETGETDGTGTDESTSEPELSEYDTQTLETLQSINTTLTAIQAENELWHTETLKYREETAKTQESIIVHLEFASLLLIAVGFFTALQCGGKFADIFFKRMKGDGRYE